MRRLVAASLAGFLSACATPAQSAENLAARVASAPDGTVAFSYAARANICGDGQSFIVEFSGPDQQHVYTAHGTSITNIGTDDFRANCTEGPVRIVLTKRAGKVVDMQPYVGGTNTRAVKTDLGSVNPQEGADYLLALARALPAVAGDAFMAAQLGEGSRVSVALLQLARGRDLPADVRESAVKWSGRTASREGTISEVLPVMRSLATDNREDKDVRERALRALGEFPGGDRELRTLYARLDLSDLSERAIRVLAEAGGAENTEFIRKVALDASQPIDARERAVRVLGEELGRLDVVRALYAQLDRADLRERAVRSVAEHLNSESAAWVRGIAENQNEGQNIRDRAIRTLGEAGYVPQLRTLYATLTDSDLKDRIIRVAGEHGTDDDLRWVEQVARDKREAHDQRDRALRVLAEHGLTTARLVGMYDELQDHDLRERLLKVIGERGDKEAIDKLIDVARNGTDFDLRRRAVRVLSDSDDPRAREFLRTAVMTK